MSPLAALGVLLLLLGYRALGVGAVTMAVSVVAAFDLTVFAVATRRGIRALERLRT